MEKIFSCWQRRRDWRGSSQSERAAFTARENARPILKQGAGAPELIDRLHQEVGRLDIPPQELESRNQTKRSLQDYVSCLPGRWGKGLAFQPRDCAGPLRIATSPTVSSYLSEGCSQERLPAA